MAANYQLAHEVIHSLSPMIGTAANVLEEGVAAWFARYYVKKNFNILYAESRQSYTNAREFVEQLLAVDKEAIKKLRLHEPNFERMTERTFVEANINVDNGLIDKLLRPFAR